jgi:tetratricopeptide (TPR) repeat protein
MATDFRQFDEHGFPVPPRFEDQKFHEEEPPRRPKISLRAKRWIVLIALVGIIVPVMFGPQIVAVVENGVAQWFSSRAQQKLWAGNVPGAIADLSRAIRWSPHSWELYFRRAECREKIADLNGSLDDWNQIIGTIESSEALSYVYAGRSWVYMRLQRQREAVDDATHAVQLNPSPENLNSRAYIRALADVELPDALNDINRALSETGEGNPEFLDTRGYVLFLLGRNDDALKDLDRAVKLTEQTKRILQLQQRVGNSHERRVDSKQADQSLAVMYHHRGLLFDKLGRKSEAEKDLRQSKVLGYDPEQGVM